MKPSSAINKKKKYTTENLQNALDAVSKGMSQHKASKIFNIPRGTLGFRIKNPCKNRPGPNPTLSEEEEKIIAQWIVDCYRKGFPTRKSDTQLSVANLIKRAGRTTRFKNNIPGNKWYGLFLRRHPELGEKTAEPITSGNVTKQDVKDWFHNIELYLRENNYFDILLEPSRVFNGDESSFLLCPKSGKVITCRAEGDIQNEDQAAPKKTLTVLFAFSATGEVTSPLVIFPNKFLPKTVTSSVPSEWGIGLSDSGSMNVELLYDYIENVFHPYLVKKKVTRPVILFLDGHKTHLSLEVTELCNKLQIILIALYRNTTGLLKQDNMSVFRPLKHVWKATISKWKRDNPLETLTRNNFVSVLKEALENGVKDYTIINGFKNTGLCPWNSEAVNYENYLHDENTYTYYIVSENKPNVPEITTDEVVMTTETLKQIVANETKPNVQEKTNDEVVMTAETLKQIVGYTRFDYLQSMPVEYLTETERILKKICCYFDTHQKRNLPNDESDNDEAEIFCVSN